MYQEYFQFAALPFSSAPDAKVYYANPVYQTALDTLRHGVVTRKGLMVLSGAAGIGKTALLKKLFADLGPSVKPIWFAGGDISLARVVKAILTELGSAADAGELPSMMDALHAVLLRNLAAGSRCCLIFEDAQNLDAKRLEELRQLDNLAAEGRNLLQIILVGQPELVEKLNEPENHAFKQRVALSSRLFILVRSEVARYIKFHLDAAGYRGEELFASDAINLIAHYSGGMPRLVNTLCDSALLAAYRASARQVSQSLVDEVATEIGLSKNLPASVFAAFPQAAPRAALPLGPGVVPARPHPRLARVMSLALLSLLTVGGASWGLYSGAPNGPEREKRSAQAVGGQAAMMVATVDSDPVRSNSRLPEAVVGEKIPKPSVVVVQQKPQESITRPTGTTAVKAWEKLSLKGKVQQAIRSRAIEGVSVRVVDRRVHLEGVVGSERLKDLAEKVALEAGNVAGVTNRLKVRATY